MLYKQCIVEVTLNPNQNDDIEMGGLDTSTKYNILNTKTGKQKCCHTIELDCVSFCQRQLCAIKKRREIKEVI